MICTGCGQTINAGARFCSQCGKPVDVPARGFFSERLMRPRDGRMIAGVCAGFALRYGWDVALVRLVLVLALIFGAGTPLLAYLIAWIIMPNEPQALPAHTGTGPGSMAV